MPGKDAIEKIANINPAISFETKNRIEYLQNNTEKVLDNVEKNGIIFW